MMTTQTRITAFSKLGDKIKSLSVEELKLICVNAEAKNNWFTEPNVTKSLSVWGSYLNEKELSAWVSQYKPIANPKKVGVVMAGNVPLVGFHDLLCVLISGHTLLAKLSSDDEYLMRLVISWLIEIEPQFKEHIQIVDRLNAAEAYIATGSNNSARYFEYYFASKPHIIRRNRTSVAVLSGKESTQDFINLAQDIFSYYGLGCRNISKLFVPKDYSFSPFYDAIEEFSKVFHHHKYNNNYDYHKSIMLVERTEFLDNGFLMIKKDASLHSPVGMLYFEEYTDLQNLKHSLDENRDQIQAIASEQKVLGNEIPFGKLQCPSLSDYADGVDTMQFLAEL